jgi:hypothetical protein
MGSPITRESLQDVDTATISRMWDDVGGVCEMLTRCDLMPGIELLDLADMLFDELVDRKAPVTHQPAAEAILGIVEIEPDEDQTLEN